MKQLKIGRFHNVGEPIQKGESSYLKEEFEKYFPFEKKNLLIKTELIKEVIVSNPDLCGIKFLYGLKDENDPETKIIFLVPCKAKEDSPVLFHMMNPDGYFTHTGERMSLSEVWRYINNHVIRSRKLEPSLLLREVNRSVFFGLNQLNEMVSLNEVSFIKYHFGYDSSNNIERVSDRYRVVLEPFKSHNISFDIYIDHGELCPGGPCPDTCLLTEIAIQCNYTKAESELDIFRNYRDELIANENTNGGLVEMYYHISPVLIEQIRKEPNSRELYEKIYYNHFADAKALIESGKKEAARDLVGVIIQQMMNKYILN